jgi:lysine 2,3-aminomutase
MDMIKKLRGHISGICVPYYMIDLPKGGGKVPILPEYIKGFSDDRLMIENYEEKVFTYPEDLI